jgi:hypothetical protein
MLIEGEDLMDVGLLVKFLAPYLPFLTNIGRKMVEKGAEKLGEQGATEFLPQAKRIWEKLHPKVKAKAAAQEAVDAVVQDTGNIKVTTALIHQLKKILEAPENAVLTAEIVEILRETNNYPADVSKFNVHVQRSQVGSIGDGATVNMNFVSNP